MFRQPVQTTLSTLDPRKTAPKLPQLTTPRPYRLPGHVGFPRHDPPIHYHCWVAPAVDAVFGAACRRPDSRQHGTPSRTRALGEVWGMLERALLECHGRSATSTGHEVRGSDSGVCAAPLPATIGVGVATVHLVATGPVPSELDAELLASSVTCNLSVTLRDRPIHDAASSQRWRPGVQGSMFRLGCAGARPTHHPIPIRCAAGARCGSACSLQTRSASSG